MSDTEGGSLQFEKAEFGSGAEAASACARCGKPLRQTYFTVDGAPACPVCRNQIATEGTAGSGPGRFARACILGGVAGAVGAALWYGIREATGYEVGLISILLGIMVGIAVRIGSRGRGGLLYQALAVFITYSAIASTYIPPILSEFRNLGEAEATEAGEEGSAPAASPEAEAPREAGATGTVTAAETEVAGLEEGADLGELSAAELTVGIAVFAVIVVVLAYAAPFLGGVENIIGIAIIAFGLWEAWRINRRQEHTIDGPFRVGEAPAGTGTGAVPGV